MYIPKPYSYKKVSKGWILTKFHILYENETVVFEFNGSVEGVAETVHAMNIAYQVGYFDAPRLDFSEVNGSMDKLFKD